MKSTKSGVFRALALILVLAGCDSDPVIPRIEDAQFAESLKSRGLNLSEMTQTPQGLYVKDLVAGTGTAAGTGSHVFVYYTGWLADGTQFDSAWPPEKVPFDFRIGYGGAIVGFALGTRGMQVGGKRLVVIPPALGYGGQAVGTIPANSILVFEIELVDVQ